MSDAIHLKILLLAGMLYVLAAASLAAAIPPTPPVGGAASTADATSPAICGSGPLEILLTNDDGYQAAGIRALYVALKQAGHHVRLAAPASNASGSSASYTWSAIEVIHDPADPYVVGVSATPATTVVLAATALYPPGRGPDLVISGINDGENTGSLLMLSGTIGAALAGTILLDPPVPGIAVSAERPTTKDGMPSAADQRERMARHLAQLVGSVRGWFCDGGRLARPTTVLNVNYPARTMAEVRGVAVARQGRTTDLHLDYEATGTGAFASRQQQQAPAVDYPDSDVTLLGQGFVTVTPISARLGEHEAPVADLKRRLDETKFQ